MRKACWLNVIMRAFWVSSSFSKRNVLCQSQWLSKNGNDTVIEKSANSPHRQNQKDDISDQSGFVTLCTTMHVYISPVKTP